MGRDSIGRELYRKNKYTQKEYGKEEIINIIWKKLYR